MSSRAESSPCQADSALTVEQATTAGPGHRWASVPTIWSPPRPTDADAHVKLIELLGPRAIVTIDARGTELTSVVEASRLTGITEGATVDVSARPGAVHVFDTQTGQRVVGTTETDHENQDG